GSINIIRKTGFSRTKPQLTYNAFLTYSDSTGINDPQLIFGRFQGPDHKATFQRVEPAFNLSYIHPINKSLAVTLSASYAPRFGIFYVQNTTWDQIRGVQTSNTSNSIPHHLTVKMASASAEWRITKNDTLRASIQASDADSMIRQNQFARTMG